MKTINLVTEENCKITRFPDGQQMVDIDENFIHSMFDEDFIIKSRLNSFNDLELILCAIHAIKNRIANVNVHLAIPYMLGGRSDRAFKEYGVNYIKQIIAPIINSTNVENFISLDPHSYVTEACVNNFSKASNPVYRWLEQNLNKQKTTLISPDAGAYKKVFDLAKELEITNIVNAVKVRDVKTGEILKTEIPQITTNTAVIVDDICDGGRTFIELSKVIRKQNPEVELTLAVTHGIFSKTFDVVAEHFDHIITTNSYKDLPEHKKLTQLNLF